MAGVHSCSPVAPQRKLFAGTAALEVFVIRPVVFKRELLRFREAVGN